MSRWTAFFWGAALSTGLGVAAYVFTKRRQLTSEQLVELAKERLRQEQQTKRTKHLLIVGTAAIGGLYFYMQLRRLFVSSSRHHHHHHHE